VDANSGSESSGRAFAGPLVCARPWLDPRLFNVRQSFFDLNYCVQIGEFLCSLSRTAIRGLSGDWWPPETAIRGFVSVLFQIIVVRGVNDNPDIPAEAPLFVSDMIETGVSPIH
jgi:hypothetical protein